MRDAVMATLLRQRSPQFQRDHDVTRDGKQFVGVDGRTTDGTARVAWNGLVRSSTSRANLSPASIFATRDWLDFSRRANSPCVKPRATRLERSAWLRANRVSTSAAASELSPRKLLRGPDAPASRFQTRALRFVHVTPSLRRHSAAISSEIPQ